MLVSVVIPTYNEKDIYTMLSLLVQQTVFKNKDIEIVLADYDPNFNEMTHNGWLKFKEDYPKIVTQFAVVDRRGIAYARHTGIIHSKGDIIVNMDADSHYATKDGIEVSIKPILNSQCVMTCIDNILNLDEVEPSMQHNENILIVRMGYTVSNQLQREAPIVSLEPGMCFTRYAYNYVGGFNDIKQSEGAELSTRIIYHFGLYSKKHVPDTSIIVSARRAIASTKYGIIPTWFNYDNAYRL